MIFILFSLLASTLVSSAPTTPLDAATLLQNGLDAQSLNSEFKTLQIIDACTSGQTACISNAVATCLNNQWSSESCPTTEQCFALPSVRENGTFVACTSEAEALSIISATGAPGGLFSNTTANSVPFPSLNCTDQASSTTTSATSTATDTTTNTTTDTATATISTAAADDANATATTTTRHHRHHNGGSTTVTVVLASGTFFTLPAQTQTLAPDAAASLLSSLLSNGASAASTSDTSTVTTSSATTTATATDSFSSSTASTTSSVIDNINTQTGPVSLTSAALTTIQLTGQVAAASTPTASSTDTSGPGYGY